MLGSIVPIEKASRQAINIGWEEPGFFAGRMFATNLSNSVAVYFVGEISVPVSYAHRLDRVMLEQLFGTK